MSPAFPITLFNAGSCQSSIIILRATTFSRQSSGIFFTVVSKFVVGVYLLAVRVSSSCRRIDAFYSQPQAVLAEDIIDRILYAVFVNNIAFQTYYAKYVRLSRY